MKAFIQVLAAGMLSLMAIFSFSSCAVLVIGAAVGTAAYLNGELESSLPSDIRGAVAATNKASDDIGLMPVSRTGDTREALMIATDRSGRKVRIKLTPDPMNYKVTEIKIRVGVGGNEDDSRRILGAIRKNL